MLDEVDPPTEATSRADGAGRRCRRRADRSAHLLGRACRWRLPAGRARADGRIRHQPHRRARGDRPARQPRADRGAAPLPPRGPPPRLRCGAVGGGRRRRRTCSARAAGSRTSTTRASSSRPRWCATPPSMPARTTSRRCASALAANEQAIPDFAALLRHRRRLPRRALRRSAQPGVPLRPQGLHLLARAALGAHAPLAGAQPRQLPEPPRDLRRHRRTRPRRGRARRCRTISAPPGNTCAAPSRTAPRRGAASRWREEYDHIVVGGGAAGCVAAARLVEAGRRVLLLEAGHSHHHPLLDMPPGIFKMINGSKFMRYHTHDAAGASRRPRARDQPGQRAGRRHLGERAGLHARPALGLRRVGRAPARQQCRRALGLGAACCRTSAAWKATTGSTTSATTATGRCWSPIPATSTTCRAGSCRRCRAWACRSRPTSTAPRQRGVGFYQFMNRRGKRSQRRLRLHRAAAQESAADAEAQRRRPAHRHRERARGRRRPIATAGRRAAPPTPRPRSSSPPARWSRRSC